MYLIVGLGNPGDEYAHTRHNAGFDTVDVLAEKLGAHYWKTEGGALTAKVKVAGSVEPVNTAIDSCPINKVDALLVKPQSFMNTSGGPVKQLVKAYNVTPDHLIVIQDDMDLPTDTIRVRFAGGHAGHNGLKSINDKLGTRDYFRVRIGVGHPAHPNIVDYVLSVPKGKEKDDFEDCVVRAAEATLSLIANGLEKTQQEFN